MMLADLLTSAVIALGQIGMKIKRVDGLKLTATKLTNWRVKKMKLYEMSEEFKALERLVDDGELSSEDIADTVEALDATFSEKIDACLKINVNHQKRRDALIEEADRLMLLADESSKKSNQILDYVKSCMLAASKDKIDTALFKLTLRKAVKKIDVVNESKIPDKYFITVPASKKLDKRLLLSDAKLGDIDGAKLIDGERNLAIK